jgi:hypothetical protein
MMLFKQQRKYLFVTCHLAEHAIPDISNLPAIGRAISLPLFFVPSHYPESSISVVQQWSAAVNFLQKQQKQRRAA